VYTCLRIQY